MTKKMLIDATQAEETRVAIIDGNRLQAFDFDSANRKQLKGNLYLAKVTRVEPSLQACFVEYGGNRQGFLAFSEIHPDYYRIPVEDREALLAEEAAAWDEEGGDEYDDMEDDAAFARKAPSRHNRNDGRGDRNQSRHLAASEQPRINEMPMAQFAGQDGDHHDRNDDQDGGHQDNQTARQNIDLNDQLLPPTDTGMTYAMPKDTASGATPVSGDALSAPVTTGTESNMAALEVTETALSVETALHDLPGDVVAGDDNVASNDDTDDQGTGDAQTAAGFAEGQEASPDGFDVHADLETDQGLENGSDAGSNGDIQQVEKDQTVETVGGDDEDSFEEQEQTARRHSKLRRKYKIQEVIKRRQIMLVQITKEERGNKGAALTSYISLPGRYCVLMPNSPRGGGISRKIDNHQDRRRMRELLDELEVPGGMSVILRTAGMQRTKQEVKRDLDYLLRLWDEIRRTTLESVAPAMIYEEADIFKRAVRDLYSSDTEEIQVAGSREAYTQVRDFMKLLIPSHAKRVRHYADPIIPLFQRHQVETQIDQIYSPRVELKSGGYIIINPTEALVSIDVNSGRSTRERHIDDTALNTNLEAAEEIARQLRLRDLGGLVVIDFIDMENGRHNAKVERRLKDAMASDRARIEIGRVSPFGLLELSRQRLHPSLTETHFCPCPSCDGTGLVRTTESAAVVAIRMIEDEAIKGRAVQITASLPQQVAVYMLNHKREALQKIDDYLGCRVAIHIDEDMMPNDIKIDTVKGTPQPKVKPPENLYAGNDEPEPELPLDDEFEDGGEPLFPHLLHGADEGSVESASYPRSERGGRGRGRRGGRGRYGERREGSRENGRGDNRGEPRDTTIIPITTNDAAEGSDDNAISAPPSFGRRRSSGRNGGERAPQNNPGGQQNGGERRGRNSGGERGERFPARARNGGQDGGEQGDRAQADHAPGNGAINADRPAIDLPANDMPMNDVMGSDPVAVAAKPSGRAPRAAFPAKANKDAAKEVKKDADADKNVDKNAAKDVVKETRAPRADSAKRATAAQPVAETPAVADVPEGDDNQPKKRGWWSKLVNTDTE